MRSYELIVPYSALNCRTIFLRSISTLATGAADVIAAIRFVYIYRNRDPLSAPAGIDDLVLLWNVIIVDHLRFGAFPILGRAAPPSWRSEGLHPPGHCPQRCGTRLIPECSPKSVAFPVIL